MSDNTAEEPMAIQAAPIVSQPVVVEPAAKQSHTRTILEIVGGVVAIGLIFFSGAAGFVLGHVTAKHDGRDDRGGMAMHIERGDGGGRMLERGQGFQGGPNLQGGPGFQQGPSLQGTVPSVPQG